MGVHFYSFLGPYINSCGTRSKRLEQRLELARLKRVVSRRRLEFPPPPPPGGGFSPPPPPRCERLESAGQEGGSL